MAHLADLGLNPLAIRLIALDFALLGFVSVSIRALGLSVRWSPEGTIALLVMAALIGLWLQYGVLPGSEGDARAAELVLVVSLLILFAAIASPGQYPLVALGLPYADRWLAAADARLGVSVPALAAWTRGHAVLARLMAWSYVSLLPQFLVALLGLTALRRRERLWEYAFHFHVCLVLALAALAAWPAVCPPAYYGFTPTIDMSNVIAQIEGFHGHTMTAIPLDRLEGLVSFPSFHVAGGIVVTWVFRGYRRIQIPLLVLNVAMIASTVVTGVHYAIDVLAAAPLVGISMVLWRFWGRSLVDYRVAATS